MGHSNPRRAMYKGVCMEKLQARWATTGLISVGLDPIVASIPRSLKEEYTSVGDLFLAFNRAVIDATADLVCAYKPNNAFYEAEGEEGLRALKATIRYINKAYPDIPVILDAKRGDIGSTSEAYARAVFDDLGADAVTVHPYLGQDAVQPFLDRADKGVFVLARTSNSGSGEFQNLHIEENSKPLYAYVAETVAEKWNTNGNCGLVVGATYPEEIKIVRSLVGEMPLLIPGVGTQGGDALGAVTLGCYEKGKGVVLNTSRAVLYASPETDFAEKARVALEALTKSITQTS